MLMLAAYAGGTACLQTWHDTANQIVQASPMLSLEGRLGVGACCRALALERVREGSSDPKRELSLN